MTRKFKKPEYATTANTPISLGEAIPANHLARFVVDIFARTARVIRTNPTAGTTFGCIESWQSEFGWQQDSCRCFKKQSGQLRTVERIGNYFARRSCPFVCVGRTR